MLRSIGLVSLAALAAASGAYAQTGTGSGSAAAQGASPTLDVIVVTAQKREESLQDAALAVTALSGNTLEEAGISQATDLNSLVPGLGIAQGGVSTQIYLRGVGNYATTAMADPAVTFNLDGVYISRFTGIAGNFFDLSRIEVLKGPQGTLYGRNSTGGALNVITNAPTTDEFGAGIGVEIGDYNLRRIDGYVNMPLSDTVAFRLSAQDTSRDGYQSDGYDDDDTTAIRAQLLFEPSDQTSIIVRAGYLDIGGQGSVHVPYTNAGFVNPSDPWEGQSVTLPGLLPVPPPVPALYAGLDRSDGFVDIQVTSFGIQLDQDLSDNLLLTVLANYVGTENASRHYGPGFLVDSSQAGAESDQTSFEARLTGSNGNVDWVAGVYYFEESQTDNFWVDQGFLFNQTGFDIDELDSSTLAAFGQATFHLDDTTRLTAGVRFTSEEKSVDGTTYLRAPNGFLCSANGLATVFIDTVVLDIPQAATNGAGVAYPFPYCQDVVTGDADWTDTSWRLGIDHDLNDDSMIYFNISRGYKGGGFFPAGNASLQGNLYEPETLLAYAVGTKNRFADGRIQLNVEAFYWDYQDHQESYLAPTSSSGTYNFVTQRADGEIYGLDIEFDALLTENDEIGIKLQYLHAEYTDAPFIVASPGPGNPSPRTVCATAQDPLIPSIWYNDCSGQEMPRSPELSATVAYHHTFSMGANGDLVFGADARFSGEYWAAVDYNPLQRQDAFTELGANLTYYSPDDTWSLAVYGANLTDEVIFTNAFMYPGTNSVANGGAGNIAMVQLDAPRTYGIRFRANY